MRRESTTSPSVSERSAKLELQPTTQGGPMAGRASNGESTIYKGADGRWHGYVSVGFTLDGRPDRRHVSSTSRGVVVTKVRELERKRDSGTVGETSTPTVAWWLEHWLTTIAPRRVRRRTLESYESAVRKHLVPGIGRHRMDRLRPEHLDQLYTALLDDGYSPASVLRHHRILSRALTVAVQRGHVPRNVAALVDPPAQRPSDIATALDLGEARAVLHAAAGVRNSARWTVALALGPRQSRRSHCSERTSTRWPAPSPCDAASTGSGAGGWSTRSPRPAAASAR
jgi:integrase